MTEGWQRIVRAKWEMSVSYKKNLRRTIMLIVLALVAFYVINFLVTIAVALTSLVLSGALNDLFSLVQNTPYVDPKVIEDILLTDFPYGLASAAGIVVGSLALLIVRGKLLFTKDLTRADGRARGVELAQMMGIILGFNAIVSFMTLLFEMLAQMMGISSGATEMDMFSAYMNVPGLLYVVLLGPLFEEIIFRGAILRSLQPYGDNFAIVLSSLLFGLYHLILFQGIFACFVGLILAYCTLRFSIRWSMVLHILNNGIAMALLYFDNGILFEIGIYLLFLALALAAGALGIQAFRAQIQGGKPRLYGPSTDEWGAATRPRPFAISFSSVWLIVALVITLLASIQTQLFMLLI
jgi:membrane protease YdiL (CAAX protease family)